MKNCFACEKLLEDDAKFCDNCGKGQQETIIVPKNMSLGSEIVNPTYTVSYNNSESEIFTLMQIKNMIREGKLKGEYWAILNNSPNARWKPIKDILNAELRDIQGILDIINPKVAPQEVSLLQKAEPPNFAEIAGGTFQTESDNGKKNKNPVNMVTMSGFAIAKYPVTQKEWFDVMGTTVEQQCNKSDRNSLGIAGKGDNYPMYYVSWYEAIAFCYLLSKKKGLTPVYTLEGKKIIYNRDAKGYRLPTEAEWEYAARGGDGSPGNFTYSGSDDIDEVAWYNENSGEKTHPVGTKKANGLGLYDMSGNVWEWCWDWYEDFPSDAEVNPVGASSGYDRILRGGSWFGSAQDARSTYRGIHSPPYNRHYSIGFRVVRTHLISSRKSKSKGMER
jgi:formylglycine-generating enzyme required for sulfatase activity